MYYYLNEVMVMSWKSLHIRKYYRIVTFLELVIPIVIFAICMSSRFTLEPISREKQESNSSYSPYLAFRNIRTIIGYAPHNSFTYEFLKNATKAINKTNNVVIKGKENLLDLKSWLAGEKLDDDDHLSRFTPSGLTKRFGVHFESGPNDKNFRYIILTLYRDLQKDPRRMFSDTFAITESNKDDEYLTSGFVALQYLLDRAFIEKKWRHFNANLTEFLMNLNVSIHKIPYEKDFAERNPEDLIYHITLIGFVFLAATTPYYIATEKHSGMKIMMKMAGMSEMSFWFGWITYSLMVYVFITLVIVVILKASLLDEPYFSNIDPILLWSIFILYSIANMAFLFAISSFFSKHWIAVVFSVIASFVSTSFFGLTDFTNDLDQPRWRFVRHFLLCICPNLVMHNALKALQYFQLKGKYTGLDSFLKDIEDPQILSLRLILVYFLANILFNSIAVVCSGIIFPGRYGIRKNPLFLLGITKTIRKKGLHTSEYDTIISNFIEPVDESEIGIQLYDVHKNFGYFPHRSALKNINLNILKGEITVILGHNGAGKTTLLNVICGMSSKSSGELLQNINGELRYAQELVGKLGFCPQNVIYFNYLTVEEHILFFAMARGFPQIRAVRETQTVMHYFGIQDKADSFVNELSGGMKRKLGLLIALIGRPEIVILDEPTSGMDVNSRRSTWDLLKKMKKNRIIIMTTQDMEEADVVGNRIAIMHDGEVFCYGSSNFLKDLFGTGYNLTLFKGRDFDMENTTKLITDVIPSASVTSSTTSKIEYNLPLFASDSFTTLFRRLENEMSSLSFTKMYMAYTTMDQVYMNVTFLAGKNSEKSKYISLPTAETSIELRTGISLIFYQLVALFVKKFKLTSRRHHYFLSSIVIAVLLGIINVYIFKLNFMIFDDSEARPLNLSIRSYLYPTTFVYFSSISHSGIINEYKRYVHESGGKIQNDGNEIVTAPGIPSFGPMNLYNFRDNLIGAVFLSENEKRIYYNELIPHSPPISLNIYTNAILRYRTKNTPEYDSTIQTSFLSISLDEYRTFCVESKVSLFFPLFWWMFFFHSAVLSLFVLCTTFLISQRIHGVKHILTMSNLSEWTYWLGNFIYDFSFIVFLAVCNVLFMKIADFNEVFDLWKHLILAMVLYGSSGLVYCYVFSSLCDSISIFILINVIMNMCVLTSLIVAEVNEFWFFVHVLNIVTALLPPFSFLNFIARFFLTEIEHSRCAFCSDFEKGLCEHLYAENIKNATIDKPVKIGNVFIDPPIQFVHYLFVDIFIYAFLLCVINSRLASWMVDFAIGICYGRNVIVDSHDEEEADKYVRAEKEYIKSVFDRAQPSDHALMVYNLKKNILSGFEKFTPVAGVNFFVDKGSCFGIVGVNGAGKSTIFKILTGLLLPTEGDAKVHNISLRRQLTKYKSMISSCPQMDITYQELTAREMLHLTATLRGLMNADKHVQNWISILDMKDYQDNLIETYSTGGRRKLCVALSLIGDPKVVFLDEPTSGVDPLARQYMYQIINSKKLSGQSVVIASHNMKECEVLCDRVTVLHNGILKRIGSVTALKKQYANGFTLVIKLRLVSGYTETVRSIIVDILESFEPHRILARDQRLGLLQFRILNEDILWSEMFGEMAEIKKKYDTIIEDFMITNATIAEEVFISSLDNPIKSLNL